MIETIQNHLANTASLIWVIQTDQELHIPAFKKNSALVENRGSELMG
jgi:hypothetical protein